MAALAAVVVGLVAIVGSNPPPRLPAGGSTLEATLVDSDGNGTLEPGPGAPMIDRTELASASATVRTIATFAQITDAHLRDEESPARVPVLDRLSPALNSTFRPQEALSPQVLAAAVNSVNALRPDAVLETGDLIDSAQRNELEQALSVLKGGRVDPNSGAPGYDGIQSASNPDPLIYRPDLDSPRHPGLLDRAQRRFESPGLDAPWYPVLGNHDLLVQGEVPPTPRLDRLAVGGRELVGLNPNLRLPKGADFDPAVVDRFLAHGLPGPTKRIAPDPARRHLTDSEVVGRLRRASNAGGSGPRLDYRFDVGSSLRMIVLDVVRRQGGSDGEVGPGQRSWLGRQLVRAGDRYVIVLSHEPLQTSAGGGATLALLDRDPHVIAAIDGHTHRNSIEPRRTGAGGYWLIGTASLTDFPQQSRAFRLVQTEAGVALETWMLNTAASGPADTARQLAYLDAGGGRPQGDAGRARDRNVRLFLGPGAGSPR